MTDRIQLRSFLSLGVALALLLAGCAPTSTGHPARMAAPGPVPPAQSVQPIVKAQLQPLWDAEARTFATLPRPPGATEIHRDPGGGVLWTDHTASASLILYVATNPTLAYDQVLDFYARALPVQGWTVHRDTGPFGPLLRFTKGETEGWVQRPDPDRAPAEVRARIGAFAVVVAHAPMPLPPAPGTD